MKIKFLPQKNTVYYPVSYAVDVEIRSIAMHATEMAYDIELLDYEDEGLVEVLFTEANHHIAKVQIFNLSKKTCSCEQYLHRECGYCKHIAIIDFILRSYNLEVNYIEFGRRLKDRITDIFASNKYKYKIYDSFTDSISTIGRGEEIVKSASLITKEKKSVYKPNINNLVNIPNPYVLIEGLSLYDYQHDILRKILTAKRAICAMDMGAGKTLTSVAGIQYIRTNNVLISCPKSVINQWVYEIKRVLNIEPTILNSRNVMSFAHSNSGIGICTHQTLARNISTLSNRTFDVVIADEIQFIRNDESKTWSAFKKIKSEYFWGLSGTVIENRLDDLYNIMSVVAPNYLGPKWKFEQKFKKLRSIHRTKVLYDNEVINLPELRNLISSCVFSYNKLELDEPVHINHFIGMSKEAKRLHDNYYEAANRLIAKSLQYPLTFSERAILNSHLLRARQCCNTLELVIEEKEYSEKIKKIISLISEICIHKKQKLVVYSEWTTMLDIVQREVSGVIGYTRFDGQMSIKQRNNSVQKFLEDDTCLLFFSSDAGSIGLDKLQFVCHNMIHVELPWNPAKIDQRIGRLRRLKQTQTVNVHYIIATDSIESKIHSLLSQKRKVRMNSLYGEVEELDVKELL